MVRALLSGFAALSLAASALPALAQTHGHCFDTDPQLGSSGSSVGPATASKKSEPHTTRKAHKTHKAKPAKPAAPAPKS